MKTKKVYFDCDLLTLSAVYLSKIGKPWNVVDLLFIAKEILERSKNKGNRFERSAEKYRFKNNICEINEDFINSSKNKKD